ncbi:hypothetical protein AAZX31_04G064200 [Glycine max]
MICSIFEHLSAHQSIVEGPSLEVKTCPIIFEDEDAN